MFDTVQALRSTASADAAFGLPHELGDRIIIPVACVQKGFGLGFGRGTGEGEESSSQEDGSAQGGGGGGRAGTRPIAVIEVTSESTVVKPIIDETAVALAGIAMMAMIAFWVLVTIRKVFAKS
jgi:uncharacterized spore protein YtfJ